MRDLSLVGLSEDRGFIVLRDSSGETFRIPADDRLRAALSGDRARLGQLEIQMDSALRPRDIQARIRRGDSAETVAEVAQVPVERIMAYAIPVLAEREHICDKSRTAMIRRTHITGQPATFGAAVDATLRERNVDESAVEWDSWRRADGRWVVSVRVPDDEAPAQYLFDPPGRFVVADDERASLLVGDIPDDSAMALASAVSQQAPAPERESNAEEPADDDDVDEPGVTSLKRARARRAQAQEQLLLDGEQAAHDSERQSAGDDATTADLTEAADQVRTAGDVQPEPVDDEEPLPEQQARAAGGDPAPEPESQPAKRSRRRERRRVPSWDEIMFGNKPEE